MQAVQLVITTLGVNRIEYTHSQRLKQLLDCKKTPYDIDDLSLSQCPGIRQLYRAAGKLFPTKRLEGQTNLPLPQLFVKNSYIGGYEEVQSLDDAGVLSSILTGNRCPHVYLHMQNGYVMDSLSAFDYCPLCTPCPDLILGVTEDYCRDINQYKLWRDLLNSRVRFGVSFAGRSEIQGRELTRERLQIYVDGGCVRELMQRERCVECGRKTILKAVCESCGGFR
jgi:hypothetical protein